MKNLYQLIFIFTVVTMISCGDKKDGKETITIKEGENSESIGAKESTQTQVNGEMVEISLSGNDQMQFDKKEIRVRAGQVVRLTFSHTGQMAKNVMGHNFVLLKKDVDINQFGNEAVGAASNDYIPQNTNKVIIHTKMLGGGESTTIEFKVPATGSYDFICSFPGHYSIMRGKFIVE